MRVGSRSRVTFGLSEKLRGFNLDQNWGERLFSLISHMAAMPSTVYLTSGYKQYAIGINTRLKQVKIENYASSVVSSHGE
jgi:hypothetical protein